MPSTIYNNFKKALEEILIGENESAYTSGEPVYRLEDVLIAFIKICPPFPKDVCLGTEEARKIISLWRLGYTADQQTDETLLALTELLK